VGEDTDTSRTNEAIGYVVIETGSGTMSTIDYVAGLGTDTVRGVDDSPPYTYPLSGLSVLSPTGIVSQAGMDGADGSWAILYGVNPVTSGSLNLAVDEDQTGSVVATSSQIEDGGSQPYDLERGHTTEQVGYIVFDVGVVF